MSCRAWRPHLARIWGRDFMELLRPLLGRWPWPRHFPALRRDGLRPARLARWPMALVGVIPGGSMLACSGRLRGRRCHAPAALGQSLIAWRARRWLGITGVAAVPFLPTCSRSTSTGMIWCRRSASCSCSSSGALTLALAVQGAFHLANLLGAIAAIVPTSSRLDGQKARHAVSRPKRSAAIPDRHVRGRPSTWRGDLL